MMARYGKRGLIFTISVFFMFMALFTLITALRMRHGMVESLTVSEMSGHSLYYAREDIANGALSVIGIDMVNGTSNVTTQNLTFTGQMDLSIDFGAALFDYMTFYRNYVFNKSHVNFIWGSPKADFIVKPLGTTIGISNKNLTTVTSDYARLKRIDVDMTFATDVSSISCWADQGAGYPLISVNVYNGSGVLSCSVRRNPTAGLSSIDIHNGLKVRFGYGSANGTFVIDNGNVNITRLSFVYNNTGNYTWLETQQNVRIYVGDKGLAKELVIREI
jgi:hypothetical protein